MSLPPIELGLDGVRIEPQPLFGDHASGVLHILSGGEKNPAWFGGPVLDVYACFGAPGDRARGGHAHRKLNEMFMTVSGTALWILSDLRSDSTTFGKTAACILGWDEPAQTHGLICHTVEKKGTLGRLRVPAGIYHMVCALGKPFLSVALGTTVYDAADYDYPAPTSIPQMEELLMRFGLPMLL